MALLGRKLAPLLLGEPGFFSLERDLADDGAIERGMGRLAARARPEALGRHLLDHLLGVEWLLGAR